MNELEKLKRDIAEFETFKNQVERQQVSFPLDINSTKNIQRDIPIPTGAAIIPAGLATFNESIEVRINQDKYWLETTQTYLII